MLSVSEIDIFYGDAQALWSASIEVRDKEIVALLGSNGAGKSSMLKAISGLLPPRNGQIEFGEMRIDKEKPFDIVEYGISHVLEGRKLFPNMTVLENLFVGAYNTRAWKYRHETARNIFEMFPLLRERSSQYAGTLSGGEQQMLAIGRGLMSKPTFLMLDEPSLGLAPMVVEMIFQTLTNINRVGLSILLVEQNAQLALEKSTRGYIMDTGRISMEGTAKDLMQSEQVKKAYLGM